MGMRIGASQCSGRCPSTGWISARAACHLGDIYLQRKSTCGLSGLYREGVRPHGRLFAQIVWLGDVLDVVSRPRKWSFCHSALGSSRAPILSLSMSSVHHLKPGCLQRGSSLRQEHQSPYESGHRRGLWALALIAAAAGFAFGCATDTRRIELKVSDPNPAGTTPALASDAWAEQVTQQSAGRLTLTVYHAATLLSANELFVGVQTGIADFGVYVQNLEDNPLKDDLLLNNVVMLPFMGWPDQRSTGQIYLDLLAAYPAMKDEWKGLTVVGAAMMSGMHIHNVVRDIRTPTDLSGLKTVAAAGVLTDSAHAAGALGVSVDIAQLGEAVVDGTVDAVIDDFAELATNNVLEPFKYHTLFGDGGINMTPLVIIVNSDVFNSLSADLQGIVAASGSFYADQFYALDAPIQAASVAQAEAWNHSLVRLTPAEIAVWYELVKVPVHDQWVTTCEVNGLPGQAVYADTLQRIQAVASP